MVTSADLFRQFPIGAAWCAKNALALSVVIALSLALAAVLVRNVGDPVSGRQRRTATVVLLLLAGLALAIGGSPSLAASNRWGFMLAFLPGVIIARHAVYMRLIRRRAMAAAVERPPALRRSKDRESLERHEPGLPMVFARARQMQELDFAPDTLAIRYGVPALVATAIAIGVFATLRDKSADAALGIPSEMMKAARYGATGAMVYVLLYLAQRGFRNDITTGAAIWSAVVLAVGPMFSAVLAVIWKDSGSGGSGGGTAWTREALYFAAGMFPRHAASGVEEVVRRLWLARSAAVPVQPRLQPLSQLRGITQSIEDRLTEEGIADVQGMAMADPLKLFRATSFDKRQILSWMDEAILIYWLPEHAAVLQKIGITGAIDLMAHVAAHPTGSDSDSEAGASARTIKTNEPSFSQTLKDAAKLEASVVDAVMQTGAMLKEDAQLRLVWALYQFDEENLEASDDVGDAQGAAAPPPATLAIPALGWLGAVAASLLAAFVAGDCQVQLDRALAPLASLIVAFAIALTVRWPWASRSARALPLTITLALVVIGVAARAPLAVALAHQWPSRDAFLAIAAVCGGVFVVRLVDAYVGATLTIDFPHGIPPECELWVDGRSVLIDRLGSLTAVCRVPGRWIAIVASYGGVEQRRWLDARGRRALTMSFPLQAVLIVQVTTGSSVSASYFVDGVERKVGPLSLAPRTAPYAIGVEADGYIGTFVPVVVPRAEIVVLPVALVPEQQPATGGAAGPLPT